MLQRVRLGLARSVHRQEARLQLITVYSVLSERSTLAVGVCGARLEVFQANCSLPHLHCYNGKYSDRCVRPQPAH